MKYDLLIIGGGAAGLASAVSARKTNKRIKIAVLEKNDRVGKKILATGNGRCNFTNADITSDSYFGDRKFIAGVLEQFGTADAVKFFEELGIMAREEDGRIYPRSNQATAVLDALRLYLDENSVDVITCSTVDRIKDGERMTVGAIEAERVIVAAGGSAAPNFGSDGQAYGLLTSFGHRLVTPKPALVSVKTDTQLIKGLKGVKVHALVEIEHDGKKRACDTGEVLFTDYGLSGIPVMQISRFAEKGGVIKLDMMPEMSLDETVEQLSERRKMFGERKANELYSGMMNKKIVIPMLRYANIDKTDVKAKYLTDKQVRKCAEFLKNLNLVILGTSGMANAQVTAGGIATDGFEVATMESKYKKGLYAAGEILDCDGLCGGFNLHWAWATGVIAGKAAGEAL